MLRHTELHYGPKNNEIFLELNLFRMGFFGAARGWGGGGGLAPKNLSHTSYNDELGTVIPCLKKSQKNIRIT